MRLEIELTAADGGAITVPLHYNRAIQGMIYQLLRSPLPELHDRGFTADGRVYRLFVFSRIAGSIMAIRDGSITFRAPIGLKIASPVKQVINGLVEQMLSAAVLRLGNCDLCLQAVAARQNPDFSSGFARVRAISPITVYSTLFTPQGSKKTYYYGPHEKEFAAQVRANLIRKGLLLGVECEPESALSLEPVRVAGNDMKTLFYGNHVIRGWLGRYILKGDPRLLDVAYDAGIGSKNAQGFGMIEAAE